MKLTRTCNKCGWLHPSTFKGAQCKACRTRLHPQWCHHCSEWKDGSEFYDKSDGYRRGRCKPCDYAYFTAHERSTGYAIGKRHAAKVYRLAEERYDAWRAASEVSFKPMSEREWLDCCNFFGGCAICSNEYIETRQFFVQFESGGRYAAWNMIPMCEQCARPTRQIENPFLWLKNSVAMKERGINEVRRQRIVDWLTLQIEKVSDFHE